ncbi:DUF3251 domain-containing protein [Phenylobacterium terrae]|uniref:DUF3251 domain-containing protein n=1 Tax=Phenylobacterium terrae TaxID=2665495 RepID=A0ABW4N5T9_9CAUL
MTSVIWRVICTAVTAAAVGGCEYGETASTSDTYLELTQRVEKLEASARTEQLVAEYEANAFLKPTDREYSWLKTDFGMVAVAIEAVSANANGSRVVLTFGNPSSAGLTGISATVDWGRVDASGTPVGQPFSKEVTFDRPLLGGTWRNYPITLADVPPAELGYIRVKNFQHKQIFLNVTN